MRSSTTLADSTARTATGKATPLGKPPSVPAGRTGARAKAGHPFSGKRVRGNTRGEQSHRVTAPLDPVLDQWIARFRGPLTGLLASWGSDWAMAEELAMDTFAEAWLGRARLRGKPSDSQVVGPWLRGIAANLHRSSKRRLRRLRQEPLHEDAAVAPSPDHPDDRLDTLRAAFAQLRADQQMVLRMFYLDEASTREVAALLALTEKAVEGRLHQARRALREKANRMLAATTGGSR